MRRATLWCGSIQVWQRFSALRGVCSVLSLVSIAACSQMPAGKDGSHAKIDSVWGVEAPKKMVADGQPVPPGGGRYQVGKPYMVGGRMYFPREDANYDQVGEASWYGSDFHGRETANGEVYDKDSVSAAHKTLPIPCYARVTNLDNGRSIIVRVNDRGPYVGERLIDVSERTAELLTFKSKGLTHVRVQYVGPAPVEGSDQRMLVASLRNGPASTSQDRALIAQADRVPSDGRVAGLAAANLGTANSTAIPQRPMMMAALVQRETPVSSLSSPRASAYGPHVALPAPVARPPLAVASALPAKSLTIDQPPPRGQLPANSLGSLSSRGLGPEGASARPAARPPQSGTLDPLPSGEAERSTAPMQLAPGKQAASPPAPGAIVRLPPPPSRAVVPSRYGPNGENPNKIYQSQGYATETASVPAQSAITRLIALDRTSTGPRIDLGAYAHPEIAARVADLMQPYGRISTKAVVSGMGEQMIVVELEPSRGMIAADVISIAEGLGIHSAALVD